jgi:hypothetical protein
MRQQTGQPTDQSLRLARPWGVLHLHSDSPLWSRAVGATIGALGFLAKIRGEVWTQVSRQYSGGG